MFPSSFSVSLKSLKLLLSMVLKSLVMLISGFHHALLQAVSFIIRLKALDYTNLEVKIYVE